MAPTWTPRRALTRPLTRKGGERARRDDAMTHAISADAGRGEPPATYKYFL